MNANPDTAIPRVLLVDDEKPFVEAVARRLAARGFDVEYVLSGPEALERLRRVDDRDVVVLDMKMPGMDGLATLLVIKKEHPLVEVILLTGHATVSSAVAGIKAGAMDYLTKPCDLDDLIKKIGEAAAEKARHQGEILDIRMKPFATAKDKLRQISRIKKSAAKGNGKYDIRF